METFEKEYERLERDFITIAKVRSIKNINPITNSEKLSTFVDVMGNKLLLRDTVVRKLHTVATDLRSENKDLGLHIFEGLRTIEQQTAMFEKALQDANGDLTVATRMVCTPDLAPHCTGGAIDVTLFDTKIGKDLPMGTAWKGFELGKKNYYASPEITGAERQNRDLLRQIFLANDFKPFDPEWWHFSYGDATWAYLNGLDTALYGKLEKGILDGKSK